MKVTREQVQQNREHILAAAARLFRERGVDGVSIAEIMNAAGLTHGGFYGHFDSKDALVREALIYRKSTGRGRLDAVSVAEYADAYLSTRHRDDPGNGCPIAGVGSAAARGSAVVRATLTKAVTREIERFSPAAPGATPAQRRRSAIATVAAMVGAMVLARIVDDKDLSDEILKATRGSMELA